MSGRNARKRTPRRGHIAGNPAVESLREVRRAALPPAPSLQVAIALLLYSITRASNSDKPS